MWGAEVFSEIYKMVELWKRSLKMGWGFLNCLNA